MNAKSLNAMCIGLSSGRQLSFYSKRISSFMKLRSKTVRNRNLLISNTLLCCFMSGFGDFCLQSMRNAKSTTTSNTSKPVYDRQRTFHLTLTGLTVGPCFHYWYQTLDKYLPGRSLSTIAKKVLLDQILFSPVCLTLFFTSLGFLDWSSWGDIGKEIFYKGRVIYAAEWFVWPPAQMLNFYFVPLKFRVMFSNFIAFGFSVLQSHVRYLKTDDFE